jgi:hypothetical protein
MAMIMAVPVFMYMTGSMLVHTDASTPMTVFMSMHMVIPMLVTMPMHMITPMPVTVLMAASMLMLHIIMAAAVLIPGKLHVKAAGLHPALHPAPDLHLISGKPQA